MDVVHFATRLSKPSVVTYHSDIIRQHYALQLYRPLKNQFLRSVDRIVATSPNYFITSKVLQQYASKTRVIPIGLDQSLYSQPSDATLDRWRSRAGDKFFLFVGALRYYKGLHILLDAVKGTNLSVVIVGAGPIEQQLRKQALRLNLSDILFLGEVSEEDKAALLTLCTAVVFPSHLRSEAFGISLLEGAMFGKPMISSEIGTGTTFVNIGGETGLVVLIRIRMLCGERWPISLSIPERPSAWVTTRDCAMRCCSRRMSWYRNILISTKRSWPTLEPAEKSPYRRTTMPSRFRKILFDGLQVFEPRRQCLPPHGIGLRQPPLYRDRAAMAPYRRDRFRIMRHAVVSRLGLAVPAVDGRCLRNVQERSNRR